MRIRVPRELRRHPDDDPTRLCLCRSFLIFNPKGFRNEQSETTSADAAELPDDFHRPATADGFRCAVDRSSDLEEQCGRPGQGGEAVQYSDHHHYRGVRKFLGVHLPRTARCVSEPESAGTHVYE